LGDQIEKNAISAACSTYRRDKKRIQDLVGIPEGKRQLGRPRRGLEDNIKLNLQEVGWEGID
jgi:hypothetical protein